MNVEQLTDAAGKWGFEEELGQIWLERKEILLKVNSLPPQMRERRLKSILKTLRARLRRQDSPPQEKTFGRGDISPDFIRRKW